MKYLIIIITLTSFAAIGYGFSIKGTKTTLAHKFIGGGTAGLFLVAMPLFLYKEGKGKKVKDYMLTEDNIKKMRENQKEKPRNQ